MHKMIFIAKDKAFGDLGLQILDFGLPPALYDNICCLY